MLDKKSGAILRYFNRNVGENFTVVSKGEVLTTLQKKMSLSADELNSVLNYLQQNELVDVKYNDENEVCLAVTGKGVALVEHAKSALERAQLTKKQYMFVALFAAVGAFLGTLVASLLFRFLG